MNQKSDSRLLKLALRRDRGYVYFPDAITACLEQTGAGSWSHLVAECYKTSDRELVAREEDESDFSADVFGRVSWQACGRARRFVLLETSQVNEARYDLTEPPFRSVFHLWAVQCKKLFHETETRPGWRMLLQRMSVNDGSVDWNEELRLDFMTKDGFLKFSFWRQDQKRGEVVASGRDFGGK